MNDNSFIAPIIDQLIAQMGYILPVLVIITIIKTSWFKGKVGEFWINIHVKMRLDDKVYRLIKNVTLPTDDGSTQIDHILVSVYGVFVIETKNMKGWIFGGEHQRTWTQKLFKESYKFQNPLFQNYKHTQTLIRGSAQPDMLAHAYRLSHPLGEWSITTCLNAPTPLAALKLDYEQYGSRISVVSNSRAFWWIFNPYLCALFHYR